MKVLGLFFCIFFCCSFSETILAQNIIVDDTYTAQQLVENVLINSPCANVSNFTVSGGNFTTGEKSYGYFTAGTSSFPFANGIVLSTSRAVSTEGPNTTLLSDDAAGWVGDSDLNQALSISNTSDATILEFDFIPLTSQISFDYIFASEEYHDAAPCHYSDGFAFLLKEVGSTSTYQNLALVPFTSIPVKVTTVHPLIPGGCPAQNETYFGSYNTSTAPINFNGQTVAMTAKASVTPGTTYHIKLVIADETNPQYDSAIFLGGGSFNVGTDLGPDRLMATNNPICYGDTLVLNATEPGANTYQWFKNGTPIAGQTNPTYTVTDAGLYRVEITVSGTCVASGEINIEYTNQLISSPVTLLQCDDDNDGITNFNLTKLDPVIAQGNTQIANITYYNNIADAQNSSNPITNPLTYQNTLTNQIIAAVTNTYGCVNYITVNLQIASNPLPAISPIAICDEDGTLDGFTTIDLSQSVTPQLLNGLPNGLVVEYYASGTDAVQQNNPLPNNFTNTTTPSQTIYARIVNGPDCYGIIPVVLQVIKFNPSNFNNEDAFLCDGGSLLLAVPNGFASYLWNTTATTSSISVTSTGNYTVTVTNSFGCEATKTFTVSGSSFPIITSVDINDFSGDNTVQINTSGSGNYEYSLDGEHFQDNALFINVPPDEYTIVVRDKNGCNPNATQQIYVLDYPKYFTPNGDGIHDIWQIKNLSYYPDASINIFDRFGKLVYSFKPIQIGWDGNLNGKELFADDYWFVLSLGNGRTIKGHFALKR